MKSKRIVQCLFVMFAVGFVLMMIFSFSPKQESGSVRKLEDSPALATLGLKDFPNRGDLNYFISYPGMSSDRFSLFIWGQLDKEKIDSFAEGNNLNQVGGFWNKEFVMPPEVNLPLVTKLKLDGNVSAIKGLAMSGEATVDIFYQENDGTFFGRIFTGSD